MRIGIGMGITNSGNPLRTPWNPLTTSPSTLKYWGDSTGFVVNGSNQLTEWTNNIGSNGFQMLGNGDPSSPGVVGTLNGYDVLDFNGSMNMYLVFPEPQSQPITIAVVIRDDNPGSSYWWDGFDATDRLAVISNSPTMVSVFAGTGISRTITYGGSYKVAIVTYDTTSSSLWVNGVQSGAAGDGGSNSASGLTVASRYTGDNNLDGQFAEFIFWTSTLTDAEKLTVSRGLMHKFGL